MKLLKMLVAWACVIGAGVGIRSLYSRKKFR